MLLTVNCVYLVKVTFDQFLAALRMETFVQTMIETHFTCVYLSELFLRNFPRTRDTKLTNTGLTKLAEEFLHQELWISLRPRPHALFRPRRDGRFQSLWKTLPKIHKRYPTKAGLKFTLHLYTPCENLIPRLWRVRKFYSATCFVCMYVYFI